MPEDPPEPQLLLPPASLPPPPRLPPYPPPSPAPIYPPLPEPFPDSTVPEPPSSSKALPPLSPSLTRRGSPYALTGGESQSPAPSVSEPPGPAAILPLRQIQPGGSFIYVPFTTTDLYNWKHQNPPFSEKPQALISLLESVFRTHIPTWDDCQQLLQTLFTSEERERILQEARKVALGPGSDICDPLNFDRLQRLVPTQRPDWDPTTDAGKGSLDTYHQYLLGGLRSAARKPTNLTKVGEVVQGKTESPSAFLERLLEAYRVYTPINPEAPENAAAINLAFVSQSAPDIRKKLQKLEGFQGKNRSELLNIAQKVFDNRDSPEEAIAKRLGKVTIAALAAQNNSGFITQPHTERPMGGPKRRPGLSLDQCAYCKEKGHWKNECPRKLRRPNPKPILAMGDTED
ncbi:uncharacterized protein RBU33_016289 [Hipposideros larvatus]